jgi:L-lactate dehydrogenase
MARDPVCGMQVNEQETQHRLRYEDKTYYFCSSRCKKSFEKDPAKYVNVPQKDAAETRKVVVLGAGQVGSTFAFALTISGLATTIVLVDQRAEVAEGHVMDLNHGLSFAQPCRIYAGDYSECKDADVVVVTAGAPQKPGETRLDLAQKNTNIFKSFIPQIAQYNAGILLIVANPVDVLTYAALKLSEYPMNRVFGSGTVLDTARFRYLLSRRCEVDPRNVHAYIIGEHGDTEVPLWSQVRIGGVPFADFCRMCNIECPAEEKEEIFEQVKNAAYEIINSKGYTNFAIALALVRIVSSILRDESSVLTVSTLVDDYYGISDVCLSTPVILNRNGVSRHLKITLNDVEKAKLEASARALREVIQSVDV